MNKEKGKRRRFFGGEEIEEQKKRAGFIFVFREEE